MAELLNVKHIQNKIITEDLEIATILVPRLHPSSLLLIGLEGI